MTAIKYISKLGAKLIGSETGYWLADDTSGTGATSSIDISSTELDLTVNGILSKSPVNNNSGLQYWSGFTVANYLSQSYNSAMDYGTSGFYFACDTKFSPNTAINTIFERDSVVSAQRITGQLNADGTISFVVDDGTTVRTATTTKAYDDNKKYFFEFIYELDGTVSIKVDTVEQASIAGIPLSTMTNTSAVFRVGLDVQGINPAVNMSINLIRTGLGAVTTAQIKQVYDQEKQLFRPYTAMQIEGQEYGLDVSVNVLDNPDEPISHSQTSLGGNTETTFIRSDDYHNFFIIDRQRATLPEIKAFFKSVQDGETFTFDPHGSIASPDDPVQVIAEKQKYNPTRNGTNDEFSLAMKVREV